MKDYDECDSVCHESPERAYEGFGFGNHLEGFYIQSAEYPVLEIVILFILCSKYLFNLNTPY